MPIDSWLVEEKISLNPAPNPRESYIRLLQEIIDTLKEEIKVGMGDDIVTSPAYALPTVIFAYLDTESKDVMEGEALAQLYCYRDRREFLKDLTSYGDEDYLREFGLRDFLSKTEPNPPNSATE